MPLVERRFRTHIGPFQDGCELVNGVADRVRAEMFRRIGLEDLLRLQVKVGLQAETARCPLDIGRQGNLAALSFGKKLKKIGRV